MTKRMIIRTESFSYEPLVGGDILPRLAELGDLRIAVFREFPYLYDGDAAYEQNYLGRYAACDRGLVVLLRHEGEVVGASTCLPLEEEIDEFRRPFAKEGYDPRDFFYFGESVILPRFRGRGAGKEFFRLREAHAKSCGSFRYTTFCAVDRPEDHRLRPENYRPLDGFWGRRGYRKHDVLQCELPWREIGSPDEILHRLTFWIKDHGRD